MEGAKLRRDAEHKKTADFRPSVCLVRDLRQPLVGRASMGLPEAHICGRAERICLSPFGDA
jgi:hypothetical protein